MTLSITDTRHNNALLCAECRYAECHILFTIMLSVVMLSVVEPYFTTPKIKATHRLSFLILFAAI
jgi:hypothetical protein